MGSAILSDKELEEITGYTSPNQQLNVLHQRGFVRAFRSRHGNVILEQPHFQAVCRGVYGGSAPVLARGAGVNLSFMDKARNTGGSRR